MIAAWLQAFKRLLRTPVLIVGELLVIAVLGGLGAALPQAGVAPAMDVARLRTHGPLVTSLVDGLALDHLFTSPAFLSVLGVATLSLSLVVIGQWRRLPAQWQLALSDAHFRTAPFRKEFTRPAASVSQPKVEIRTLGRLGLAGSPLFHTGILCVILAGILRALFGAEATVDLYEGERLPATVEAWGAQWPGALGRPFRLDQPALLESVQCDRYSSGEVKELRLRLRLEEGGGQVLRELAVNEELQVSRGRLYAGVAHGPAALLEWEPPSGPALRTALLLEKKEPSAFGAYAQGPGTYRARIRVPMPAGSLRPSQAELRILQDSATLAEAVLRPGESMPLPDGGQLHLRGLPLWARLHGNHDPALGLAYAGFALALLGGALIFAVVRVDQLVEVTREGDSERVRVALRPHRFVPLFQERFERLVRENGGGPC